MEAKRYIITHRTTDMWLGVYYSSKEKAQAAAWLNNLSMKDGWTVESVGGAADEH